VRVTRISSAQETEENSRHDVVERRRQAMLGSRPTAEITHSVNRRKRCQRGTLTSIPIHSHGSRWAAC